MNGASVLLFAALSLVALVPTRGAEAEAGGARRCGRAGALRCDADGRHLSVCTSAGTWLRVRNCGAHRNSCVDAQCVPAASARADTCSTPSERGCSRDCKSVTLCSTNNYWVEIPCSTGQLCSNGQCVNEDESLCKEKGYICGTGSANTRFPALDDCSTYYICPNDQSAAIEEDRCTGSYYQPCFGDCIPSDYFCKNYTTCEENDGYLAVITDNPSLYYICFDGSVHLMKCDSDEKIYDSTRGECIDIGYAMCN